MSLENKNMDPRRAEIIARLMRADGGVSGVKADSPLSQNITQALGSPEWMTQVEEGDVVIAAAQLYLLNSESSSEESIT